MKPNLRRCISCRKMAPKETFWRIIRVHPSQQVQLDQGMGRSAYLCRNPECLAQAHRQKRLGKALKTRVPEQLYQTLNQRLQETIAGPYSNPPTTQPHSRLAPNPNSDPDSVS